jgi:hypothetical protein
VRLLLLLLLAGCATNHGAVSCYGWPDEIGRTLRADSMGRCYLPQTPPPKWDGQ